jgi:ADP-ribose pyrophosphatase YjhB (NUDIX family)
MLPLAMQDGQFSFRRLRRWLRKPQIELVVAGIVIDKGKALLVRHPKLGKWLPPGGHIKPGETPDDAVRRELREEVGLVVELIDYAHLPKADGVKRELALPFYVNVHCVGDHDHCCFFYRCRVAGFATGQCEDVEVRWIDITGVDSADIPEDVKQIVKLAARKL